VLNRTLSNADEILRAAKSDQRNISQALKMANVETGLGEDDGKLEELRWYVYPKECAAALSKGTPESPKRDVGSLLGALRPSTEVLLGEQSAYISPTEPNNTEPKESLVEAGDDDDNKGEKLALELAEDSQMFMFRDGEHTGEALFEEISAGFDDGEVSEACEIFDSRCGEWVSFKTFIQTAPVKIVEPAPIRHDKSDSKNEKKKASRGSSSWGQGRVLPLQAAPVVGWAPSIDTTDETEAVQREDASGSPQIATAMVKRRRTIHVQPPKKMMRLITQAVLQWDMLKDGDKLLLGLSGGKDSLSLLHCLMEIQRKLPIKFEIEVCTIDPMTPSFDPSPLIPYVESLGLKHHYIRDDIVSRANSSGKDGKIVTSLCSYCARMKRGNLYACARSNNCNKLVLAQHLDDCAESFMMSLMHNGFLRTMKANYKIDAGDLSVIRPMVYCRESLMTDFAKSVNLPVINENCPACFEEPKERARIKKLLNREETLFPNFYDNIRHSLIPLMHDDSSAILKCYTEDVLAKTRKKPKRALVNSGEVDTSLTTTESRGIEKPELQSLRAASDDDLVRELARRRAEQFLLSSGMKGAESSDPTGQVCTLNGGNGSIPCYELME
jgi:tRNA(Ile)-lysidine synthase TilS/MesJ